ncbi:MAG TPA: septal ring lytic transglycosylase RlpA family protein [Nitrosomonas sp.]|nr:septal ring lytic transglycosylase RlpA family protein [Nitrosomonas sp.]
MNRNFSLTLFIGALALALSSTPALARMGYAVHYSDFYHGKRTASSEIFDQNKLTAAHHKIKFGSRVKVTNLENNRSVVVTINDRMAESSRNIIDVSKSAAARLRFVEQGRTSVRLEILD